MCGCGIYALYIHIPPVGGLSSHPGTDTDLSLLPYRHLIYPIPTINGHRSSFPNIPFAGGASRLIYPYPRRMRHIGPRHHHWRRIGPRFPERTCCGYRIGTLYITTIPATGGASTQRVKKRTFFGYRTGGVYIPDSGR